MEFGFIESPEWYWYGVLAFGRLNFEMILHNAKSLAMISEAGILNIA